MKTRKPNIKPVHPGDRTSVDDITLTVRQEFIRRLNEAVRRMNPLKGPHYEADAQGKPYIKQTAFSKSGFMLGTAAVTFLLSVGQAAVFHAGAFPLTATAFS